MSRSAATTSIRTIAWREIRAHRGRVASIAFSIILGVSFVAGTLILTDTIGRTFDDLFADVNAGTDSYVRAASKVEGDFGDVRARLPQKVLRDVRATEGVRVAIGGVQSYAQVLGSDGEPIGDPSAGPPTFGATWGDDDQLNPFRIDEGRPPAGPNEVVLDKRSAEIGELEVGDTTTVLTQSAPYEVTVVGIAKFGSADSPGGASFALFDLATAQELFDAPGQLDAVVAAAEEGISEEELTGRLQAVLGDEVEVLTGSEITEEDQNQIGEALGFFNGFLLTFAFIALFVGAFIINNTFSILIAQRTREFGLLRALGATRRQINRMVFTESALIGVGSSVLGLVAGIGLAAGLKALLVGFGIDLPSAGLSIEVPSMITAFVLGVVVTLVSSIAPVRRAAKVSPIAALREADAEPRSVSRRRGIVGIGVTIAGLASIAFGIVGPDVSDGSADNLTFVGVGAMVTFIGVAIVSPLLAKPIIGTIGRPIARLRGVPAHLAKENALRSPRRTASTASALMIGVGLVGLIMILAASIKASVDSILDEVVLSDFIVESGAEGFGGVSPALADDLRDADGVGQVLQMRFSVAEFDGESRSILGVNPDAIDGVLDLEVTSGDTAALAQPGTIALSEARIGVLEVEPQIGDLIDVTFADTGIQRLRVAAIYDQARLVGGAIVGLDVFEANVDTQFDNLVLINLADGADPERARTAIEGAASAFPTVEVQDLTEFKEAQGDQINQLLALIFVLLFLAVLIAMFGIANTLVLSILERTHELGLLRAVGMQRRQMRTSVRWESVFVAVLGAVVGLAVALFFGTVLVAALGGDGLSEFVIPFGQLIVVIVVAALAGVIAAIFPARRAARLDVLAAIATE